MTILFADNPEVKNVVYSIVESMVDRNHYLVPEGNLDTTTALIYDSVNAFAIALHQLTSVQQVYQTTLDCSEEQTWVHGNSLMNYMKVTPPIMFTEVNADYFLFRWWSLLG